MVSIRPSQQTFGVTRPPKVIFIPDAFARYIEPDVEQAALDILSMCGVDVQVAPVIGAGASLFSKGFIEATKHHAGKMLDALDRLDPKREAVIVGIEPPEIYFFKNEYTDLLPDRKDEIASRSAQTWLLDEYLLRSDEFSALRVGTSVKQFISASNNKEIASGDNRLRNDLPKIKFQPHCHQRAEGPADDGLPTGTNATVELLRACGYDVEVLELGCCGMAGTFGYDAEHYELSMKVGELKLLPYLREYRETAKNTKEVLDVEVLASGAACRMQIQQGVGMDAAHPIMLVSRALKNR